MKTKKLVLCALYSALTFIATMVIQIKLSANGFVNLGDCMVITGGIFLGPIYGALSAAVGSVLADIVSGYIIYAPATLVIKSIMSIITALIYKRTKKYGFLSILICSVVSELVMISGYFLYEIPLYGIGTALSGMPGNLLQSTFAIAATSVLYKVLIKNNYIRNQLNF